MDKEKQIEEMAKDLCPIVHPHQCEKQCFNVGNCQELKEASEKIYNLGYRKIDKDSVVLSREKYQDLKEYKNIAEQRKFNLDYANLELRRLEFKLKQASKETAEKIFQRLFEEHDIFNDNDVIIAWQVKDVLKRLAKQFGVEIKE